MSVRPQSCRRLSSHLSLRSIDLSSSFQLSLSRGRNPFVSSDEIPGLSVSHVFCISQSANRHQVQYGFRLHPTIVKSSVGRSLFHRLLLTYSAVKVRQISSKQATSTFSTETVTLQFSSINKIIWLIWSQGKYI